MTEIVGIAIILCVARSCVCCATCMPWAAEEPDIHQTNEHSRVGGCMHGVRGALSEVWD